MKKRVRILFTIPNFNTAGSGIHLLSIIKELDLVSYDPQIACIHDNGVLFEQVKNANIPFHLIRFYVKARPLVKMLYECYRLSKIFKKIDPDIIHSYNYSADYTEAIAAKMAGIKWIYTKKNMSWKGPSYGGWRLRTFLADGIIAQNADMLDHFFNNNRKVKLIPMGINIDEYKKKPINVDVLKKWNIKKNTRIIISVANLIPAKGLEILIKAFESLCFDYTNWNLIIVGSDKSNYALDLKKYVNNRYILKNRVLFTGVQNNIRELLDVSEIYVQPTLDVGGGEGGPVATIEAMANSKVVIGSNIPGIRNQLLDNFSEHLFSAGSIDDLKNKLITFMKNDININNNIGKNFYNFVEKSFNIITQKNRTELFYHDILS